MIWALMAAIVVAVLAVVLWPVVRTPRVAKDRADYDMEVFQDQLKEIERDVTRGVLTDAEAASARIEIQRRILAAGRTAAETHQTSTRGKRLALAGGVAVLVPVLALGIYLSVGEPGLATDDVDMASAPIDVDSEKERVVMRLADKVEADPTNVESLALLARSYRELRAWENAAKAYEKLSTLRPDADTFASLGEMLTAQAEGHVTQEAHDALMKALELDRDEVRSRFYLGLEQAQQNNPREALAIWRDLTGSAPQDAPWLPMVRQQMASIAQSAGIPPMGVEPRHPLSLATATAAAPAAQASAPAADSFPPEQRQMIEGMVGGLAARLEQNPNDFKGWMMLGRSYTVLQKTDDALKAYGKAAALEPANIEPKVQIVTTLMSTSNPDAAGPLSKQLTTAADDVLKLDATQPDALFVMGLARVKAGDKAAARGYWERAQKSANPMLKDVIARRMKALN